MEQVELLGRLDGGLSPAEPRKGLRRLRLVLEVATPMETRICCSCGESKSVAGIWYLVDQGSDGFMCGACFSQTQDTAPATYA